MEDSPFLGLDELSTLPFILESTHFYSRDVKDYMVQWFPNVSPWTSYT